MTEQCTPMLHYSECPILLNCDPDRNPDAIENAIQINFAPCKRGNKRAIYIFCLFTQCTWTCTYICIDSV